MSSSGKRARLNRRPVVYGDAAYGTGAFLDHLVSNHIASSCTSAPAGRRARVRGQAKAERRRTGERPIPAVWPRVRSFHTSRLGGGAMVA
ncbi:MAG: hypothetical protein M0T79_12965 [Actinomycetota bacterium]|nr:hypothetical protein [Actinomycetota bacterium]